MNDKSKCWKSYSPNYGSYFNMITLRFLILCRNKVSKTCSAYIVNCTVNERPWQVQISSTKKVYRVIMMHQNVNKIVDIINFI